ncbi:hypothetical protein PR048_023059 [Dryococelus australis]|uniref:Supervillin n=1 Tax=Dryococelus australis TaxID=614101 RepID=A0ABQ9GT08_9NEOP|nr:hypothetical protein PR048_023059 [Dryococelus australis]
MKKSGQAGEISEVASTKQQEARQGVTSIQQLGYSNFQRQANTNVKRSSVRSLRETFENAIKSEAPARANGVTPAPKEVPEDSPPRTESKRLSRFDLSRIPVKTRKPPQPAPEHCSESPESKVQTRVHNGTLQTVVSDDKNGNKVPDRVSVPLKPEVKAGVTKCKPGAGIFETETVNVQNKNNITGVSRYPVQSVGKSELVSTPTVVSTVSNIPVSTSREKRESGSPKSAKTTHNRLSASQLVIERLQQNLSTKLSPETIETLKRSYSPAIERKLRPSSLDSPKSLDYLGYTPSKSLFLSPVLNRYQGNNRTRLESPQTLSTKTNFECNKARLLTEDNEDRINNNSEPIRKEESTDKCLKSSHAVEDVVLRKPKLQETNTSEDSANEKAPKKNDTEISSGLSNGVSKDGYLSPRTNTDIRPLSHPEHLLSKYGGSKDLSGVLESPLNSESSSFEEYFSSPELRNPRSRFSSADTDYSFFEEKPKRVSWTTSLLQKLSHDRPAKKAKAVRKSRHGKLVRYPEENILSTEERFKLRHASHAKKYAEHLPGITKPVDKKIESRAVPEENKPTEPENALYVKHSDIVKDADKDAYASLISKLAEDCDEITEKQTETSKKTLSSCDLDTTENYETSEQNIYVNENIDFAEKEKELLENLASDSDYSDLSDPEIIHAFVASEKSFLASQERAKKAAVTEICEQSAIQNKPGLSETEQSEIRNLSIPKAGIFTPVSQISTSENTSLTEVDTNTRKETQTNITAATKEISQGGKRSQEEKDKPSGLRKLFFHNLFSSPKRHNADDRKISSQETVQLLTKGEQQKNAQKQTKQKYIGDSKVHPSKNKPILETAFLTNEPKKEIWPKAPTPDIYGKLPESNASQIQIENAQRNIHLRSRSLSPNSTRGRSSAEPQLSPNRTIPDTSLIIEERLQKLRHENQPPKRPSSTPLKRTRREDLFHRNNSLPSRVKIPSYPVKRSDSPPTPTNELPNNYHVYQNYTNVPRQPQARKEIDHTDEAVRSRNSISSCSSSSTIVPQESPVPWNTTITDFDQHAATSRKGQEGIKPVVQGVTSSSHLRYSSPSSETKFKEIRRGPVLYHPPEPQVFSGIPVSNFNEPFRVQNAPAPSGRISAPPVPYSSHYAKPRVITHEINTTSTKNGPHSFQNTYSHSNSGLLIPVYVEPKHSSPDLKQDSHRSRSLSPQHHRVTAGTYSKVPSPLARDASKTLTDKEKEAVYQHLRARSISPLSSYSPDSSGSSPGQQNFPHKLSRQEVEALYWEACRKRSTSQQLSPVSDPRLRGQYTSTGSLPGHAQHKSDERMLTRRQQVSMGSLGGSAQLARPQPIYQNASMSPQNSVMAQQQRSGRSRSVSPGPNLRGLGGRSLSLPRHVSSELSVAPQTGQVVVPGYFERGSAQRSTIGPINMHRQQSSPARSTPTIYEEASSFSSVELRHPQKLAQEQANENTPYPRSQSAVDVGMMGRDANRKSGRGVVPLGAEANKNSEAFYHPIFKRGSLLSNSTSSMDGTLTDSSTYTIGPPPPPKRVSFTNQQQSQEKSYWPTRNGLAPEPPTRQKRDVRMDSNDSDVFLPNSPKQPSSNYGLYVNVGPVGQRETKPAPPVRSVSGGLQAPDRPLPPVPRDAQRSHYGTVTPQHQRTAAIGQIQPRQVPPPANRWQLQSESESGSEAGEVQRIMQQAVHRRGAYYGGESQCCQLQRFTVDCRSVLSRTDHYFNYYFFFC